MMMFQSKDRPGSSSPSTSHLSPEILFAIIRVFETSIACCPSLSLDWTAALLGAAQPLTHASFSTCSQGTRFAVSQYLTDLNRLHCPLTIMWYSCVLRALLLRLSNHTIPLLPMRDEASMKFPSRLLALSVDVALSILAVSLCSKSFLCDPSPFSPLHTEALHS